MKRSGIYTAGNIFMIRRNKVRDVRSRIRAVIFDFDGVILESADIKTETFRELFSGYPEKVGKIVEYHMANAGISRYVKFRYIYRHFLSKRLSKEEESELGKRFSGTAFRKVLAAPFVPGAKEFLDSNRNRYKFFIASGTPEEELREIVRARGLIDYFDEVCGSPRDKREIINGIMEKHGLNKDEIAYVGDAPSDRIAAEETGIAFVERKPASDLNYADITRTVRDLSGLEEVLKKITHKESD